MTRLAQFFFTVHLQTWIWARTAVDTLRHLAPRTERIPTTQATGTASAPMITWRCCIGGGRHGIVWPPERDDPCDKRAVVHPAALGHPRRRSITPWTRPPTQTSQTDTPSLSDPRNHASLFACTPQLCPAAKKCAIGPRDTQVSTS